MQQTSGLFGILGSFALPPRRAVLYKSIHSRGHSLNLGADGATRSRKLRLKIQATRACETLEINYILRWSHKRPLASKR